jgi:hypothetical protein
MLIDVALRALYSFAALRGPSIRRILAKPSRIASRRAGIRVPPSAID